MVLPAVAAATARRVMTVCLAIVEPPGLARAEAPVLSGGQAVPPTAERQGEVALPENGQASRVIFDVVAVKRGPSPPPDPRPRAGRVRGARFARPPPPGEPRGPRPPSVEGGGGGRHGSSPPSP